MEISFPSFEGIKLQSGAIITWENFYRDPESNYVPGETITPTIVYPFCGKNKVQASLVTDGVFTFAIFKYEGFRKPNGEKCERDIMDGEIFIGFDNGQGYRKNVTSISCHANATLVSSMTNMRLEGTYMFRLDNAGLDYWAWCYYYLQMYGSWWLFFGTTMMFVIGLGVGLCCCGCAAMCFGSSKKSKNEARRNAQNYGTNIEHVHVTPPTYSPYPDELL